MTNYILYLVVSVCGAYYLTDLLFRAVDKIERPRRRKGGTRA